MPPLPARFGTRARALPSGRFGATSHPLRAATIAIAIAAPAAAGCTTTSNILPDQLPIVTEAAEKNPSAPVEVTTPEVGTARLDGRLDAVSISMLGWGRARDRFDAPIAARVAGPWLIVQDQEKGRVYAMSQVTQVRVQRYDTSGAIAGGGVMTGFAVALALAGTVLCGAAGPLDSPASLIFGPQMIAVGIGLGAGGISLIVAGKRVNDRLPSAMPLRPRASLDAGPGGLLVRF